MTIRKIAVIIFLVVSSPVWVPLTFAVVVYPALYVAAIMFEPAPEPAKVERGR